MLLKAHMENTGPNRKMCMFVNKETQNLEFSVICTISLLIMLLTQPDV